MSWIYNMKCVVNWISVEHSLPKDTSAVFVLVGNSIYMANYTQFNGSWNNFRYVCGEYSNTEQPTHWLPFSDLLNFEK